MNSFRKDSLAPRNCPLASPILAHASAVRPSGRRLGSFFQEPVHFQSDRTIADRRAQVHNGGRYQYDTEQDADHHRKYGCQWIAAKLRRGLPEQNLECLVDRGRRSDCQIGIGALLLVFRSQNDEFDVTLRAALSLLAIPCTLWSLPLPPATLRALHSGLPRF